jgi:hypothetical protein
MVVAYNNNWSAPANDSHFEGTKVASNLMVVTVEARDYGPSKENSSILLYHKPRVMEKECVTRTCKTETCILEWLLYIPCDFEPCNNNSAP